MKINIDFGNDGISVKADLYRDGNQWCVLLGENIQEGICGFGGQIHEAVTAFKDEFRNISAKDCKEIFPGTKEALHKL